jgi:uncharacterized coiled-coil DUF342 family protein
MVFPGFKGLSTMGELDQEIADKREKDNADAEKHRKVRDKYNTEAKVHITERDKLNAQARKHIDAANKAKEARDEFNRKVREAKVQRESSNKEINSLFENLSRLKKKHLPRDGKPLGKLKKEVRHLEFKQMTQALSPKKEKEMMEAISKLLQTIKEKEGLLNDNEEIKETIQRLDVVKEEAEVHHKGVEEYAKRAQEEHDVMVENYEEGHKLRKEADKSHEKFLEIKVLADEEHRLHVEFIKKVRDYDKILTGIKQKNFVKKKEKHEAKIEKVTDEIFEKFKRGEKLSTDDLMFIQKMDKK